MMSDYRWQLFGLTLFFRNGDFLLVTSQGKRTPTFFMPRILIAKHIELGSWFQQPLSKTANDIEFLQGAQQEKFILSTISYVSTWNVKGWVKEPPNVLYDRGINGWGNLIGYDTLAALPIADLLT